MPKGVEDAVMEVVLSASGRREGNRGMFEASVVGDSVVEPQEGDSSSVSWEVGD
jgi:hypothetical protein